MSGRQMADFGFGRLVASRGIQVPRGYGQDDSSDSSDGSSALDILSQGLSTVSDVASTVSDVIPSAQAAPKAGAVAPVAATSFFSKKIAGIPMVAILALAGAGAFFVMKKKKRS